MRSFTAARVALLTLTLFAMACGDDDSGDGGDEGSGACAVSSDDCVSGCISTQCGQEISGCSADATCDAAKDTMVSCVCDAQRADDSGAVGACLATFTDTGGALSTAFADCATSNCASACGL
jgi:hypothetical protein